MVSQSPSNKRVTQGGGVNINRLRVGQTVVVGMTRKKKGAKKPSPKPMAEMLKGLDLIAAIKKADQYKNAEEGFLLFKNKLDNITKQFKSFLSKIPGANIRIYDDSLPSVEVEVDGEPASLTLDVRKGKVTVGLEASDVSSLLSSYNVSRPVKKEADVLPTAKKIVDSYIKHLKDGLKIPDNPAAFRKILYKAIKNTSAPKGLIEEIGDFGYEGGGVWGAIYEVHNDMWDNRQELARSTDLSYEVDNLVEEMVAAYLNSYNYAPGEGSSEKINKNALKSQLEKELVKLMKK